MSCLIRSAIHGLQGLHTDGFGCISRPSASRFSSMSMGGSNEPPSPFSSIGIGPKTAKFSFTSAANCSCCSLVPLIVGISNSFLSTSTHMSSPISMPSDSGSN